MALRPVSPAPEQPPDHPGRCARVRVLLARKRRRPWTSAAQRRSEFREATRVAPPVGRGSSFPRGPSRPAAMQDRCTGRTGHGWKAVAHRPDRDGRGHPADRARTPGGASIDFHQSAKWTPRVASSAYIEGRAAGGSDDLDPCRTFSDRGWRREPRRWLHGAVPRDVRGIREHLWPREQRHREPIRAPGHPLRPLRCRASRRRLSTAQRRQLDQSARPGTVDPCPGRSVHCEPGTRDLGLGAQGRSHGAQRAWTARSRTHCRGLRTGDSSARCRSTPMSPLPSRGSLIPSEGGSRRGPSFRVSSSPGDPIASRLARGKPDSRREAAAGRGVLWPPDLSSYRGNPRGGPAKGRAEQGSIQRHFAR